jgi:Na+-transporting NADH:ubiquinone oxidoreductase subunit NqrC
MAVGLKDGQVTGVEMLKIGETTGLGMEARDNPAFTAQYKEKQVEQFRVVKTAPAAEDEIQAITGATITSKAVTNAVNAVLAAGRAEASEGGADHE